MVPKPDDIGIAFVYYLAPDAEVVELVDTTDSKSVAFAGLGVRVPPSVPRPKKPKDDASVKSQLLHYRVQRGQQDPPCDRERHRMG